MDAGEMREDLAKRMSVLMKTDPRVSCYSDLYDLVRNDIGRLSAITNLSTGKLFADLIDDMEAMDADEEGSMEGNYGDPDNSGLPSMETVLQGERVMSSHGWSWLP